MEVKDKYGRTAEQIERDERLTEKLRPLMNRFLVFINFENWYIRLMDWYNDGYLYSNRDVAEELYDDWTKLKPYVDMNKIPNEIMEALVDLLEKTTLEQ